ncbi:MAG: hypothetical protein Q4F41_04020 [Eubacteriales bacterium]|nr:hypothetical protein [Eubacteriales bacterium]
MKRYYHKYFEGYEEEKVPAKNGKGTRIAHTYVSYYFRQGVNEWVRIALRILYLAMSLAAFGCLLYAATSYAHCNQTPWMVVAQALTLLAFLWFAWVLAYYVCAPKEMTIYKYKSTALQMLKVCKWLTAAFLLDAAGVAADLLLFGGASEKEELLCLGSYLLGGLLILGLGLIERALPYERLSNDKEITWYRERMEWRY